MGRGAALSESAEMPGTLSGVSILWAGGPAKRPEISLQTTNQFVTKMFETDADFVFTVTRDFVRACKNPVLILPDEVPAHRTTSPRNARSHLSPEGRAFGRFGSFCAPIVLVREGIAAEVNDAHTSAGLNVFEPQCW